MLPFRPVACICSTCEPLRPSERSALSTACSPAASSSSSSITRTVSGGRYRPKLDLVLACYGQVRVGVRVRVRVRVRARVCRLLEVAREAVVLPGGQPERELAVAAAHQLDDQARVQGAQALENPGQGWG